MQPSAALADTSTARRGREESSSCPLLILQRAEQRHNNVLTQLNSEAVRQNYQDLGSPQQNVINAAKASHQGDSEPEALQQAGSATSKVNPALSHSETASFPIFHSSRSRKAIFVITINILHMIIHISHHAQINLFSNYCATGEADWISKSTPTPKWSRSTSFEY